MTCSTSGYNERPNLPIYSAAKHGVREKAMPECAHVGREADIFDVR
jgi:hypothetical protein